MLTINRAGTCFKVAFTAGVLLSLSMVACGKPEPIAGTGNPVYPVMPPPPKLGILTVEASISSGTRFTIYSNDVWQHLVTVPVVPGKWNAYQFEIPAVLKSFRMDFSESPDAVVTVRKIRIQLPGDTARALDLDSLPRWVQYHCKVTYNAADQTATVRATDREMYMMSSVATARMRAD